MALSEPLDWRRTGRITLRASDYLIIRFPTGYTALVGLPGERSIVGHYPDAEAAQRACEAHNERITNDPPT